MNGKMNKMIFQWLLLFDGFERTCFARNHDITQHQGHIWRHHKCIGILGTFKGGKGQHIGWFVLVAIITVEDLNRCII